MVTHWKHWITFLNAQGGPPNTSQGNCTPLNMQSLNHVPQKASLKVFVIIPKKGPRQSFFWYDTDYAMKVADNNSVVGAIPKEELAGHQVK